MEIDNKYGISYIKSATFADLMGLVNKGAKMTGDSILSHVEAVDIENAHTTREANTNLEVSQNSSFIHYYHCATLCITISIVFLRLGQVK